MRGKLKIFSIIMVLVVVAACAGGGARIKQSSIDKIVIGETTKVEMIQMFGRPLSQSFGPEGKLTLIWYHVFVGPFGFGMKQQNLAVVFDTNERVERYSMLDS